MRPGLWDDYPEIAPDYPDEDMTNDTTAQGPAVERPGGSEPRGNANIETDGLIEIGHMAAAKRGESDRWDELAFQAIKDEDDSAHDAYTKQRFGAMLAYDALLDVLALTGGMGYTAAIELVQRCEDIQRKAQA